MDDKIIVTNHSALSAKYGTAGLAKIKTAVTALIAADGARGIKTRIVYLDQSASMKSFKGKAVAVHTSPRQNKDAIDAIFRKASPDYLMILGSIDIVPHQDVSNPLFGVESEEVDKYAYGDLPYACDAPYSRDAATFRAPTRVVGRLPDLTAAKDPSYVIGLLATAASYRQRADTDYAGYFGLSTQSWKGSTEKSLFNIFGNSNRLVVSPPAKSPHPASRLAPLAHFINCHGGPGSPDFQGESASGASVPISLTSNNLKKNVKPGTVVAAECCYGAELYDSVTLALPIPICQRYLAEGAYGYFGSSTIAYGPPDDNGVADIITQEFLLAILGGASIGNAALTARQRYVQQAGELDPFDLKTLAQFSLLGDPSIKPVGVSSPTAIPKGVDVAQSNRLQRQQRRIKLQETGEMLLKTKPTASRKARKARKSPTVTKALGNIARKAGIGDKQTFYAFDVKRPAGVRMSKAKAATSASRYYIAVRSKAAGKDDTARRIGVVAREVGGRIVAYRIYEEK